jgi:hypothetical protein
LITWNEKQVIHYQKNVDGFSFFSGQDPPSNPQKEMQMGFSNSPVKINCVAEEMTATSPLPACHNTELVNGHI